MTTSWADWPTRKPAVPVDADTRLFFDDHQWHTVDAATSRIIPADHQPGAREAKVVRFIDRYLAGIDYIFAAADGNGFLQMDGLIAEAWTKRVDAVRRLYVEGIERLDQLSRTRFAMDFAALSEDRQDHVLAELAGEAPPAMTTDGDYRLGGSLAAASDDGLPFFDALVLHTREGFYGDPVYGGNEGRVGWAAIGYRGPESLGATQDCSYRADGSEQTSHDWPSLIPHLRTS